uniref:Secreted RxLR effector protein 104 n=1 Tax=Plasmopara viticola TaxID=143451 RepID=RL104_PLAVT|nr:RecName: Full=Secreted RxLR effector protein 104; Flags: Precursor [Plasmopara viticola]
MRSAYPVLTALLVVASSQIAAGSGHQLQAYDHDRITDDNAVMKSLSTRFLRGSRDVHNNVANEERSVYSVLARMIKKGIKKMPRTAEVLKMKPHIKKASKKSPHEARLVKELFHAAEAKETMQGAREYKKLRRATRAAVEALEKHWNPSKTAVSGDAFHDIHSNQMLSVKKWKFNLTGLKPMVVNDEHHGMIDSVHKAFLTVCDKNVKPTRAETSYLWGLMNWKLAKYPRRSHKESLIEHAQRRVLLDMRKMKATKKVWPEWENLPDSLKFGVLDYLLNLHYQRLVRMYNIFARNRPDRNPAPLNPELNPVGNTGTSAAMAVAENPKGQSPYPSTPLTAASTSKGGRSNLKKRSKRTSDGNTDTASFPSKKLKVRSSKSVMPLLTEPTTSGDHSAPAKKSKSSSSGPSRAFAPDKSGDQTFITENSRLSFDGPSSAVDPFKQSKVHESKSLAPSSSVLTPEDVDTELSLGGIYDRSTYKAPSKP